MKAQGGLYMIRPSFKRREGNPGVRATPARGLPYLLFFFFFSTQRIYKAGRVT